MGKANKPTGVYFNLGQDLKDDNPAWPDIQQEAKELASLAERAASSNAASGRQRFLGQTHEGLRRQRQGASCKLHRKWIRRRHRQAHAKMGGNACMTCHKADPAAGVIAMFDGPSVAATLKSCGVTHIVWVPDSALGQWDAALSNDPDLSLIRVCREGEAIAVAGGLHIGGKRPIVLMQCTGLFEAGDSLRNFVHDLKLPLFFLIGVAQLLRPSKGRDRRHLPCVYRANSASVAVALRRP